MFTKSVVICVFGSAIVSTTLLGSLLTNEAQARMISSKPDEGSSLTRESHKKDSKTQLAEEITHPSRKISRSHSHARTRSLTHKKHRIATDHATSVTTKGTSVGKFSITAYSYYRNPRGELSKTATGTLPRPGRTVAVDPRVIPLGSRIYIEGVGERIAEDTGGDIKGKKLDLFLPSVQDCLQFGVREHEVHIIARD